MCRWVDVDPATHTPYPLDASAACTPTETGATTIGEGAAGLGPLRKHAGFHGEDHEIDNGTPAERQFRSRPRKWAPRLHQTLCLAAADDLDAAADLLNRRRRRQPHTQRWTPQRGHADQATAETSAKCLRGRTAWRTLHNPGGTTSYATPTARNHAATATPSLFPNSFAHRMTTSTPKPTHRNA